MRTNTKVLVVGTTSDYIDLLRRAAPGRVVFLTDPLVRQQAKEPAPEAGEEIVCDLGGLDSIKSSLAAHLLKWNIALAGVACFDCESLELSAHLAGQYSLVFPSVQSIRLCRDKYAMSSMWRKKGIETPRFALVETADQATDFYNSAGKPCVLKPLSGSGSELVFFSDSQADCRHFASILLEGITKRRESRLYNMAADCFLIEEFVPGVECSCDFFLENEKVVILRFSRKIKANDAPFGTVMGYVLTTCEAQGIAGRHLENQLAQAAQALGLARAFCMADFMICDGEISFLEISPRPGGDCLPYLLHLACGIDVLRLALDFAEKRPVEIPALKENLHYAGLRLHARGSGRIAKIDAGQLRRDPRVMTINLIREVGHQVVPPPEDYDSWYLGHALFAPDTDMDLEEQCFALRRLLSVEYEGDSA